MTNRNNLLVLTGHIFAGYIVPFAIVTILSQPFVESSSIDNDNHFSAAGGVLAAVIAGLLISIVSHVLFTGYWARQLLGGKNMYYSITGLVLSVPFLAFAIWRLAIL